MALAAAVAGYLVSLPVLALIALLRARREDIPAIVSALAHWWALPTIVQALTRWWHR